MFQEGYLLLSKAKDKEKYLLTNIMIIIIIITTTIIIITWAPFSPLLNCERGAQN